MHTDTTPELTDLHAGPAISIRARIAQSELPRFFGSAFGELAACGADQIDGPPLAIYHSFDPQHIDVEAVMPVRAAVPLRGNVVPIVLTGGPAVQIRHVGPYEELGDAYRTIEQWLEDHHRVKHGSIREVYLSPPADPKDKLVTLVVQPLEE